MNPLSENKSCNCSDNSFISDRANRYVGRATGAAPGIKSIWNSTSQAGGRPGKSSGNTSGKSRTIALGQSSLEMPCTPVIASKVPYFVTLVAPLGARAIVVKMALGAFGQRSPIRLPFVRPHTVDLGDILPLEGLLLVTMRNSKGAQFAHSFGYPPCKSVAAISIGGVLKKVLGIHCLDGFWSHVVWVGVVNRGIWSSSGRRCHDLESLPSVSDVYGGGESRMPGDGSRMHTHDHDGSEAPGESPDSILSSHSVVMTSLLGNIKCEHWVVELTSTRTRISSVSNGSSNVQPSESPYLPVLFIGTSQSRQHNKSESGGCGGGRSVNVVLVVAVKLEGTPADAVRALKKLVCFRLSIAIL
ncbi:hypothetical protein Tco_0396981 [Tanacetum coccineum]